jgi:cation transport regulator ChaC
MERSAQAAPKAGTERPYIGTTALLTLENGVEVRWLAYFNGDQCERGAVSVVGTVYGITERKKHQDREQLLMREINHRAKNMLSVVDAIAHQTAARNPEDFIEHFSERIRALPANQDLPHSK